METDYVKQAMAIVSDILGYPICGSDEPEQRTFRFKQFYAWQRIYPAYTTPSEITLHFGNQQRSITGYQLGQNGSLYINGSWYNTVKICEGKCAPGRCTCGSDCDYMTVTADWGFAPPTETEKCPIPADLQVMINEIARHLENPGTDDIQSEGMGQRSYTKFDRGDTETKYAKLIAKYGYATDQSLRINGW